MIHFFLAGLGAALGGMVRGELGRFNSKEPKFPVGTFSANIIGSLLIGLFAALYLDNRMNSSAHLFLVTGFCGGLTTFSTFSFEVVELILHKEKRVALSYWLVSLVVSLGCVAVMFMMVTTFF